MKSPPINKPETNHYSTKILDRRWLSEKVFEIELARPASFHFTPGQRIRFIHEIIERDYSLITTPYDSILALCLYNVQGGKFSPILASAKIGTRFYFTGPHGHFTFRPSAQPAVFIATGNGIAPFLSIGRSGVVSFTMLHGVRTPVDLYYEQFFRAIARLYVPCLSAGPTKAPLPPDAFCGRVTGYLEEHLPLGTYDFYLCGCQEMIRDVTFLVDERFPGSLVYTEIFY